MNSHSMLPVGTILRKTYRIDKQLANGGFGNTYVATNIEFEETVAIKEFFMKTDCQRDSDNTTVIVSHSDMQDTFDSQKAKFKKEARRLRGMDYEGIIKVHDLFEENGTAYYVMDFVDGESLKDRLSRTGRPMTEEEVKPLMIEILVALETIHDEGLLHLDLKPGNIMIDKNGKIRLIDFGSSKQLDKDNGGATSFTAQTRTDRYAPREQMESNYSKYGPWTDIYALGATMYTLLTNRRPPLPSDIDDDKSADKHISLPFPSDVSEEMCKTIVWMMSTERSKRPQDVLEVLEYRTNLYAKASDINSEETVLNSPKVIGQQENTINDSHSVPVYAPHLNNEKGNTLPYVVIIIALVLCLIGGVVYVVSKKSVNNELRNEGSVQIQAVEKKQNDSALRGKEMPVYVESEPVQKVYTIEGSHHMSGSISKYGITMDVTVNRGYVSGTYYYHSMGSKNRMTVTGYVRGNNMELEEFDPKGSNTGYFIGVFNGRTYSGTFRNYEKGTELSFSLLEQ